MCNILVPFCSRIAFHLLQPLSREAPHWDLPFLAFLVEVLKFLDLTKSGVSILKIMSRHLQSECRERRRLALRGLVVLSKDPLTARRMCSVSQSLLELLGDADGDVVSMSLRVFRNVLQHKDILVSSTTAPKLAEALLLLFDHDNSYVQVLSLELFFRVMDLVVDEGKKPLEKILSQSLLPLFFYCHDENQRIAKASRETLLRVAEFLKRRKLKQLVKKEQLWKFAERLLEEDRSRVAEHLRQTLPYLDSPQEPLREAAVRFMGMAGVLLMGQQEELHALSQGAALDQTQEQEPSRGRFRKSLKMFRKFLRIRRRKTGSTAAEGPAKPDSGLTELQAEPDVSPDSAERSEDSDASATETWAKALHSSKTEDVAITNSNNEETQGITNTDTTPTPTMIHAPTMDFFEESAVLSQQQVPGIVRNIHQSLVSHVSVDARLQIDLVRLAEEHPADVVLTLLRCAPTCDRAAAMMWRTIGSSGPAVEKVLPTLLRVMEDWPLHRMCTSDGDNEDVFALAATLVIWGIVQVPACNKAMIPYSSHLFVALLFHVVITTQQTPPEEVDNFWRACQEEHRLPSKPNRFAVQVMKALLYQLRCDRVVKAMKHKRGWDMLLCADTQHYAVGLLAREMCNILVPFCSRIAFHLLQPLSREAPHWDLPFLAFLVEVLKFLDLTKSGVSILKIMSRHLQSECRERRRLALRGLVVLSKDPLTARRMCSVSQSLLELLGDADGDVVSMSLRVFRNVLQHKDILVSSTTAPKLAEALLLLFDHDNSYVQVLSLELFFRVMDLVVDEGKKPLEKILSQSLLPLFFYCHDENQRIAKASQETLLRVAEFLKRRKLKQLVKKEQLWKFAERLLEEDRSRVAEHLRQTLPYLDSPQEPLREAAVRFM
ncbi:maestro heat-like repeat-containing protein family member 6, partial [Anomalospiza imberbis]|uniref:maestro heat-like repeat-containing protein family member 6 n=1 Tax=Anomalospiza imberbis TaxID=187417 RepID=UPI00358F4563